MSIFVLGLNHRTAPLELREKFTIARGSTEDFLARLNLAGSVAEKCVLSTCNRTEIYGAAADAEQARRGMLSVLSRYAGMPEQKFEQSFYFKKGSEAAVHLFSVAAGLDSLALGETEILGQVKTAYQDAHAGRFTGRHLNALFQKALRVGKKVRTETEIGAGKVSIASIALDLASRIFTDLASKKILVLGSGEAARMVCESFSERGAKQFLIANRNRSRARDLASSFGGEEVPFEDLESHIAEVDMLVSSTAAPHAIITADDVRRWMKHRRGSLFVIDLAVPRDVEPEAGDVPDVYLYNIDDLKKVADRNLSARREAIAECRRIIAAAAEALMERFAERRDGAEAPRAAREAA